MFAKAFLEVDGLPNVEQAPPGTPHYVHDEWGVHEGFGGRPGGSRERGRQQADSARAHGRWRSTAQEAASAISDKHAIDQSVGRGKSLAAKKAGGPKSQGGASPGIPKQLAERLQAIEKRLAPHSDEAWPKPGKAPWREPASDGKRRVRGRAGSLQR